MIRAVIYLRSSKDRSDVSIDAQRRALYELAQTRQIAIVGEFADAVESGKDNDRPAFQKLLRALREPERKWDHVLVLDTARIARRRELAIMFEEQECKRAGVIVLYKSLPDSDPITGMLLKSVLQAMDEWHSLTSRAKGLAGMAENVRKGYRAGGRAPRGYRLKSIDTGTIRDGAPVTKTRLVPGDDALQIRAYLQQRARGLKRHRALALAGASLPASTLIEIERNALTYAGHTIWNRTAERVGGRYTQATKWRPRTEWVIQRGTHDALITESEAEAIVAQLEKSKRGGPPKRSRTYLLSGLLSAPGGAAWTGDDGSYRLGKGARISAESVERAVMQRIMADMASEAMSEAIAKHYHQLAKARDTSAKEDVEPIKRKIAELDRKCMKLADAIGQTSAPAALLRSIETFEAQRERLAEALASLESEQQAASVLRLITPAEVRRMMTSLLTNLNDGNPESIKDALPQLVERIELSPATWEAVITYRAAAGVSGEFRASPRIAGKLPGFRGAAVPIPHRRRA
ncbi:MAG: recombinase family protein [Cetobacterium sp.]